VCVGECFFWYRLTHVVPDKIHRALKWLCVCVCICVRVVCVGLPSELMYGCVDDVAETQHGTTVVIANFHQCGEYIHLCSSAIQCSLGALLLSITLPNGD